MSLTKKKFVHLRNYTQYSLSKGALRIPEIINFCRKEENPAVAISDFNNLFGSMEFSLECLKSGIQPIIGRHMVSTVATESFLIMRVRAEEKILLLVRSLVL